jgi:membrane-bound metal-dependent hydrolase YbcI (DUF457 family)
MDTINHAVWGYALAKGLEGSLGFESGAFEAGMMFAGALPDVIGFAEKVIKNDYKTYKWYNKAHNDWKLLRWLPPYGLHIGLDKLTHGEGQRWWYWKERLWFEVLSWLMVIFIII